MRRLQARVERRKVAVVQRRSAECRNEDQRRDRHPGDEVKSVDESKRVGLQTNVAGDKSYRAAGSAGGPVRSTRQSGSQEPDCVLGDPVARLDVKPQEVRMHFLLLRNEVGHQRRSDLSSENAHEMKEG